MIDQGDPIMRQKAKGSNMKPEVRQHLRGMERKKAYKASLDGTEIWERMSSCKPRRRMSLTIVGDITLPGPTEWPRYTKTEESLMDLQIGDHW